jgi:hypothetical protein
MAEPEMTTVTIQQAGPTPPNDALPFNAHHSRDIWKHLLVSYDVLCHFHSENELIF